MTLPKILKKNGIDPHDYKDNATYDLFKDRKGNIYAGLKGNPKSSHLNPTNLNMNNYK